MSNPRDNSIGRIPVDKLEQISDTIDHLSQTVLQQDREERLGDLVSLVRQLFDAEACALFTPEGDPPDALVLRATHTWNGRVHPVVKLPIQSRHGGGLTGHVALSKTLTNYNAEQLAADPFSTHQKHHQHLEDGTGYSYLGIPLLDRHSHLLGVITVDNKKGARGKVDPKGEFSSPTDRAVAGLLQRKVPIVLETLRRFDAFRGILEDTQRIQYRIPRLNKILKRTLELLHGDRGDFALYDPNSKRLIVLAVHGNHCPQTLQVGQDVPDPSFMYAVWRSPVGWKWTGDVHSETEYYESHPDTRSEIAVRFKFENQDVGVLNVESTKPDAFDEQDKELLSLFAGYAAIAVRVADEQHQLQSLTEKVLDFSADHHSILQAILVAVQETYGIGSGLIYIADYEHKILSCEVAIGCDQVERPREFYYGFNDAGAATQALNSRQSAYYDSAHDPRINQIGVSRFNIQGPLVAVPLVFGPGKKVLGVLVVWNREKRALDRDLPQRLEFIATLAAARIAMWNSQRELELAQHTLKFSEQLYLSIVKEMPTEHCILRKNHDLCFTWVNENFARLVGEDPQKVVGKDDYYFYNKELADKYRADDKRVMKTGVPLHTTEKHNAPARKDVRWVRTSKFPLLDADGNCTGVQAVFRDVTKEWTATRRRRALKKRWQVLLEQMRDAVLVVKGGKIAGINRAGEDLLCGDRGRGSILGQPIETVVQWADGQISKLIQSLSADNGYGRRAVKLKTPEGRQLYAELSVRSLDGVSGPDLLVLRDLSELDKLASENRVLNNQLSLLRERKGVFICYAREHARYRNEMLPWLKQLEQRGIVCWYDEKEIEPGKEFQESIERAIEAAAGVILMVGIEEAASDFIRDYEWPWIQLAVERRGIPLFPVYASLINKTHEWTKLHWINNNPLKGSTPNQRGLIYKSLHGSIEEKLA